MAEFKSFVSGETEQAFRKFWARLFRQSTTAGIVEVGVIGGLVVSQTSTASANVEVASGLAIAQDTVGNGVSPLLNDAVKTLDVLTANPMGGTPRNDMVVFDAATSTIRVIVGTPNAVPTDPAVPVTAVPLARLRHAASATTVPAAKIDSLIVSTALRGTKQDAVVAAGGSVSGVVTETVAATTPSIPGNGVRRYKITAPASGITSSVTDTILEVRIYRGATMLEAFRVSPKVIGSTSNLSGVFVVSDVPPAAAVYAVKFARISGIGAGAMDVNEVIVEHIAG